MSESARASIEDNLKRIEERISLACTRSGRSRGSVRLLAVTKTQPRDVVEAAYAAGLRLFGENRLEEAREKFAGFHGDAVLHMIGHLQRNKARIAAELTSCVQSIDKVETAAALHARCLAIGRRMEILLELNTSGEGTKSGFADVDEASRAIEPILALPSLSIRGLMTVGPLTESSAGVRRAFRSLAAARERFAARYPELELTELSMGMSGDFEVAIEEGATMVRIGTLLFGVRGR